jgi:uncharacterized FAD-dependent dehydrogenase
MKILKISNIILPLDHSDRDLEKEILARLNLPEEELEEYQIQKRSVDARRKGSIKLVYTIVAEVKHTENVFGSKLRDKSVRLAEQDCYQAPKPGIRKSNFRPVIIGTGPAGLFAGLILAEAGLNPILLERGKEVVERTQRTFKFWRNGVLDPETNVQFGEGGAGTFSDGKLYSRIKDKENRPRKVLEEFVSAGAPRDILYKKKPHIGTLKLVKIVQELREKIISLGGEYHFEKKVVDLILEEGVIQGLLLEGGEKILADQVILAIGHSARDTFKMLRDRGVNIVPKPFSIGLRIEHPQSLIDRSQYGDAAGHPKLGAADYQLVYHSQSGRTVYSFCMCPGGTVLAASSEPEGVVTNGMSQYSRRERNANSALVVEVFPSDFPNGSLGGIEFQRTWEKRAFQLGGADYRAPVQRLEDFLAGMPSTRIGDVDPSYQPGVNPADLELTLPDYVVNSIREAIPFFARRITGFDLPDAIMTGVETRTSSPVKILRDDTFQSVSIRGLFPAGEGSGYAGGILSSAVDGIKAAEMVIRNIET